MKKSSLVMISALVLPMAVANAADNSHWGYSGHAGPEHWGEIDPAFGVCSTGTNQSPVNTDDFIDADLEEIKFDYLANTTDFINNGSSISIDDNRLN